MEYATGHFNRTVVQWALFFFSCPPPLHHPQPPPTMLSLSRSVSAGVPVNDGVLVDPACPFFFLSSIFSFFFHSLLPLPAECHASRAEH